VRATPAVRKLARDLGVEIEGVAGTGPDGRVLAADVENAARGGAPAAVATVPGADAPATEPQPAPAPAVTVRPSPHQRETGPDEEQIPLAGIRRRVAEAMVESKRTIPHITGMDEVDATNLMAVRERLRGRAEEAGVKLTYLPFIVKAAVTALKKSPMMRATVDMESRVITVKHRYNIGIATATPDGLIVPVVRDADRKTIVELAAEIAALAEQARNRTVPLESLTGGCFTITNFGSLGSWHGIPIIRPGESGILGVGAIREKVVARNGEIVVRPMMAIDVGADHRLVDGDVMASFMKDLMFYVEDPAGLLLEMV
jgi:pyruvate dehydrogenase E2 component (dihydrolipoamide acetyltransferase)